MSIYNRKYIHSNDWIELPIYDYVVKRAEELNGHEKYSTFDQYKMFEGEPGIPIMDNMAEYCCAKYIIGSLLTDHQYILSARNRARSREIFYVAT